MVGCPPKGRRPAAVIAFSASGVVPIFRNTGADLGLAASHNDVKSWHSVLPKGNRGDVVIGMLRPLAKASLGQKQFWPSR